MRTLAGWQRTTYSLITNGRIGDKAQPGFLLLSLDFYALPVTGEKVNEG